MALMDWRSQQLPTPWELSTCPFNRALAWRTAAVWIFIAALAQAAPIILLLGVRPVLVWLFPLLGEVP